MTFIRWLFSLIVGVKVYHYTHNIILWSFYWLFPDLTIYCKCESCKFLFFNAIVANRESTGNMP